MKAVKRWTGRAPRGGPSLVCADCHHYHTLARYVVNGRCGEPVPGWDVDGFPRRCTCRSEERLSYEEGLAQGLGWP